MRGELRDDPYLSWPEDDEGSQCTEYGGPPQDEVQDNQDRYDQYNCGSQIITKDGDVKDTLTVVGTDVDHLENRDDQL